MTVLEHLRVVIDGDNSGALKSIKQTEGAVSGAAGGVAKGMAGIAAGLGAVGAVAGIGLLGKIGLETAASNEQAQISFETMLGSAEKAGTFLTGLKDFAAKTPFEFPELQTAASSLISAGVEASKVVPIMTSLGNVTSGMGTGSEGVKRATVALQQMSAAGKITGEDLNQLRDAGVPVFDLLAAATGKSKEEVAGLAQAGKLGKVELDQLMGALESGKGLERFNGLMEKQSQSLTGLLSTLKDTVGQQLSEAFQPAVGIIKGQLPAITDAIGKTLSAIGPVIGPVIEGLSKALGALLPLLGPIVAVLGKVLGGVLTRLASLIEKTVAPVIEGLMPVLETVADVVLMLADAVGPLLAPVLETAAALLKALAPLLKPLATLVVALATAIGEILAKMLVALQPVLDQLSGALLDLIMALLPPLLALIEALVPVIVFLAEVLAQGLGAALQIVTPLIEVLAETLAVLITWVTSVFAADWSAVWQSFVNVVGQAIFGVTDFLSGLWASIARVARGVWAPLANGFIDALNWIVAAWNAFDLDFPGFDGLTIGGVTVVPGWDSFTLGVPDLQALPRFHSGGIVGGAPGSETLALLKAGEHVFTPEQMRAPGTQGTGITINSAPQITITSTSGGPDEIAGRLSQMLRDHDRDLVDQLAARGLVPRR
jgi:tape measure domain-containing protein